MHIDDLAELFDVEIDEDEVDTVGGLLTKALGGCPIPGVDAEVAGLRSPLSGWPVDGTGIATVVVRAPAETESECWRAAGDDRGGDIA
jgi:Mg2+/Co2+ transporter CorC